MRPKFAKIFLLLLTLWSCQSESTKSVVKIDEEMYAQIQQQLLDAQPGTIVKIPEGNFEFDRPLSLDGIANVTIQGAGTDKTILSFKNQKVGAEGLKITADSVTIQDLTIVDTKGDAIKIQDSKMVTLLNVKTTWSGGAKASNGAYGIYPVACNNVLIDHCEAAFASDAGIYVGQSTNVIVRNSYAHDNVAGIEIENCIHSEVYDCKSENNTGGILVFDLPDLQVVNGHTTRVYRNKIIENNHKNFAPEGNIVGIVPPGTGIILLAAKNIEVFDNEIIGHKTFGTAIASYQITQKPWNNKAYNPFSADIYIYNNKYERKRTLPDLSKDFGKMVNFVFGGKPQDILYDGILDDTKTGKNPMNICIRQSGEDLRFANIDATNDFKNVDKNITTYNCERTELPGVTFQ